MGLATGGERGQQGAHDDYCMARPDGEIARQEGREVQSRSDHAVERLHTSPWPGSCSQRMPH